MLLRYMFNGYRCELDPVNGEFDPVNGELDPVNGELDPVNGSLEIISTLHKSFLLCILFLV